MSQWAKPYLLLQGPGIPGLMPTPVRREGPCEHLGQPGDPFAIVSPLLGGAMYVAWSTPERVRTGWSLNWDPALISRKENFRMVRTSTSTLVE